MTSPGPSIPAAALLCGELEHRSPVHCPDDEHNFRIEYFEWTVEWFKSQLGE